MATTHLNSIGKTAALLSITIQDVRAIAAAAPGIAPAFTIDGVQYFDAAGLNQLRERIAAESPTSPAA